MSCNDTIKQRCGAKMYAPCIQYELDIVDWSPLSTEQCVTVEEVIDDLYTHVGDVKEEIDLSLLGLSCLQYVPLNQVAKVKDVLLKYETEICTLKAQIVALQNTAICDMSVTQCGLDLTGLTDACDNPITTVSDLFAYLILHSNP